MESDYVWLLLGLPVAFVLGWAASRIDLRQLRAENRSVPKAYFKGLNFLLNEQQDQAIDAFIEAVQNDPDTSELHFALGNLFRRRGEYDRAVRVHEHLLQRGDLSPKDRDRAQHALALDFLKAGLLDRAEAALARLDGTDFENPARLALLAIYERSRDWPQAAAIARKMHGVQGDFSARQAHYLCEQATERLAQQDSAGALDLLAQAQAIAPQAARPRVDLARLHMQQGRCDAAFGTLRKLAIETPAALPLAATLLTDAALRCGKADQAQALLQDHYQQSPSLDVLDAIISLHRAAHPSGDGQAGREWYLRHLKNDPSLVAAAKWLAGERLEHEEHHREVQRALDHATLPLTRYRCAACGFEARQHFWQCPGCQSWDSYPARRIEEL